jgi:hypothetical protein
VHRGEKITIRGVFNAVRPWFWRYLWFGILQAAVIALIPGAIAGAVIGFLYVFGDACWGRKHCHRRGDRIPDVLYRFWSLRSSSFGARWATRSASPSASWRKSLHGSPQRAWKLSQGTRGRIFVLYLLVAALAMAGR